MSRYNGPVCRLCRRETAASKTGEKIKLFLKGDRCLTRKCAVERRGTAPGQKTAGKAAHEDFRVRPPAAREAEDAPLLRRARNAVRELLPRSGARSGSDRAHVPAIARTPSRQRRLPLEPRDEPRAGAPARDASSFPRQRQDRQRALVHRQARRRDLRSASAASNRPSSKRISKSRVRAAHRSGSSGTRPRAPAKSTSCPSREQIDTPVDEQLIVEFYSR